jgi:hypothetical protein
MKVRVARGSSEDVQAVGGEAIDQGGGTGIAVAFAADEGVHGESDDAAGRRPAGGGEVSLG